MLREVPGAGCRRIRPAAKPTSPSTTASSPTCRRPTSPAWCDHARAGMNATVSSIHINGWFGAHNKLEGARWIVRQLWGRALDAEMDRWVYVGDSTNDQLMFQHFQATASAWPMACIKSALPL
jgi:hypothetical protein